MKADKIQNHFQNYPTAKRAFSPSFQRRIPKKTGNLPAMSDLIMDSLPNKKSLLFMRDRLAWIKDEIGNVAMTAIGTGLVAPWPIAYNPFVRAPKGATEEEKQNVKNTKKYTALRQPISAIIAAVIQIGALTPIDKLLDSIYNNNEYAKFFSVDTNHSVINSESYLKTQVDKQLKKEQKEANKRLTKKEFRELRKARIKEIENEQLEALAKKIKATQRIQVGEQFIDNHKVAKIVNDQINSYINDAHSLKIDNANLVKYSDRAKVLISNEKHLRKIFKNAPKEEAQLETFLRDLLAKEKNADVKVLIQEILDRDPDIRINRVERTLQRIDTIKKQCKGRYSHDRYMNFMTKRNSELDNIITKLELLKIKDVHSAKPNTIKETVEKVAEVCRFNKRNRLLRTVLHDTKTFDINKKGLIDKIYKDIAKGYKKLVKDSYKSANQVWKIAIGIFATIPITCNILNWVYPKVMKLVFPKLAGAKEKQNAKERGEVANDKN